MRDFWFFEASKSFFNFQSFSNKSKPKSKIMHCVIWLKKSCSLWKVFEQASIKEFWSEANPAHFQRLILVFNVNLVKLCDLKVRENARCCRHHYREVTAKPDASAASKSCSWTFRINEFMRATLAHVWTQAKKADSLNSNWKMRERENIPCWLSPIKMQRF